MQQLHLFISADFGFHLLNARVCFVPLSLCCCSFHLFRCLFYIFSLDCLLLASFLTVELLIAVDSSSV